MAAIIPILAATGTLGPVLGGWGASPAWWGDEMDDTDNEPKPCRQCVLKAKRLNEPVYCVNVHRDVQPGETS